MPVPTMLATTMQVAVKSEIVRGWRGEEPAFTGDHLVATALRFNREVDPPDKKGCGRNPQPFYPNESPNELLGPGPAAAVQRLESVEFLQLFSGEIWANLGVKLFHDWLCRRPRLLMDRFELRFDRVDQRLHLGLLRIGQVEDVR